MLVLLWCSIGSSYEAIVVYEDTGSEHPDNERFLSDCEKWFGKDIVKIKSTEYKDIWDVFERTRYLVGPSGARCTSELKRRVAENFINFFEDVEVLGYTAEFITDNPERHLWPILVDKCITKEDCFAILERQGIELPIMYQQGFSNNNCIGCVKGGASYWKRIREFYPQQFNKMSEIERDLNVSILRKHKNLSRSDFDLEVNNPPKNLVFKSGRKEVKINSISEFLEKPVDSGRLIIGDVSYKLRNDGSVRRSERVFLDVLPNDISDFPKKESTQCGFICMATEIELSNEA